MGLLDDAIREHLELKRRRGGDPAEIERAERDALGPVRREPEPIQPAGFDDDESDGAEHELAPAFDAEAGDYAQPFDELDEHDLDDPYARPRGELPPEPEPPLAPGGGLVLLAWLTYSYGRWAFGERAGYYAGIILATCVGLFLFTRILIPDVMLTLSTCLPLRVLARHSSSATTKPRPCELAIRNLRAPS